MPYIGIDLDRAAGLVAVLQQSAAQVDPIVYDIHAAEHLADVAADVDALLLEIEADYFASAAQVAAASAEVQSLRLQLSTWFAPPPEPVRMPVRLADRLDGELGFDMPRLPRWNATPEMPWNHVMQQASHNSYQVSGGIAALYADGLRSFELDIHRGAPTNPLRPRTGSWVRRLTETVIDHFDHAGGRDHDWRVYHVSGSTDSEYEYLSDGLAVIAALDATDPITVFIDNKDAFGGTHVSERFDALIESELGDRLFRPADLMARAPRAETLQDAVAQIGWPTVEELQGRVLVVLTDEIDNYRHGAGRNAAAFVAPPPQFEQGSDRGVHLPDPDAVFYNADHRSLGIDSIAGTSATNSLLRTYFNPRCDRTLLGEPVQALNYRAADIVPGEPTCPPPAPPPPEGTPVPE